jgi:hypothetical protein
VVPVALRHGQHISSTAHVLTRDRGPSLQGSMEAFCVCARTPEGALGGHDVGNLYASSASPFSFSSVNDLSMHALQVEASLANANL